MRAKVLWIFSVVIILGTLLTTIYFKGGGWFYHKGIINHNIDSVQVFYGNSYHTIYITDTLDFAGETMPVKDSVVRSYLKYIIKTNINWFPRAYNELELFPEVFSDIRQKLIGLGVPTDFIYLAFNESHLENVTSSNGMCGIWQLEPNTARRFGLRVDSAFDERLQINRSTVAAAHYISYLHSLYGNWILAAVAYNTGPGLINYDLQSLKIKEKDKFFENYYLSSYVLHIVAFKVILNYAADQLATDKMRTQTVENTAKK